MKIQWLGHACFAIELSTGIRIITDPFDPSIGYPQPNQKADYVSVSHQHYDHNAVQMVPGQPQVVDHAGVQTYADIIFTGIPTFHDSKQGKHRGNNLVFLIEAEGLRLCHLGDLGHVLTDEQLKAIGQVDILFIPVGGYYTIDANQAAKAAEQLAPRYIVPMHYKTDYINFPITKVEDFLRIYSSYETTKIFHITADDLPTSPTVLVIELKP